MKLHVLNTGSSGNCYVLESSSDILVIEAGIHPKKLKEAIGFNILRVSGTLVSHAHGDHSKYVKKFQSCGMKCFVDWEVRDYLIGSFRVKPFKLVHDVENYGFLIQHSEMGNCCYITDTHFVPYRIPHLNNMIVECNYQQEILDENIASGKLPIVIRERIINSHMSLGTLKKMLLANDLSRVNNIVLIHLSNGNSNADTIQREVRLLTGKNVHIAKGGMTINLNKEF